MKARIRPLDPARADEIQFVAQRMRATLMEVLGAERGASFYDLAWLEDRVRAHLDPARLDGLALLAEEAGALCGHLLARVEAGAADPADRVGLIATVWVEPSARRGGLARALFDAGEAWLRARGVETLAYDTDANHAAMAALLTARGYVVTYRAPEIGMVRYSRPAA